MSMTTDRPEDKANREYYKNAKTKSVRIVAEADVEYRDDHPNYSLEVAKTDAISEGLRIKNAKVLSADYI